MKKAFLICCMGILAATTAPAQRVPRKVVVEHFTNTYCSICASRNPGFYSNLWHYPGVLHLAIHPSSPYPSCPLNLHNKPENDWRTNFYGVYGGTPRLVLQGVVLSASTNYADTALFYSRLGQTSAFALRPTLALNSTGDSLRLRVWVKKVDTSSVSSLQLFGAAAEDTLFFTANNGETRHYDVFRKSFWGTTPATVSTSMSVGDSVLLEATIATNSAWVLRRISATVMLSDGSKNILQADRTTNVAVPTGINNVFANAHPLALFPVPAAQVLHIGNAEVNGGTATVYDAAGRLSVTTTFGAQTIDVSGLPVGAYTLVVRANGTTYAGKFTK